MPPQREPGSALGWALGGAALLAVLGRPRAAPRPRAVRRRRALEGRVRRPRRRHLRARPTKLPRSPARAAATARQAGELAGRLAEIARDERERIADLDGPADLDPLVERYLEAREEGIEALEAGAEAADADDSLAYATAQAEVARRSSSGGGSRGEIGLAECSRPLGGGSRLERDAERPQAIDPDAPPTVKGEIGE